LGQCIDQDDKDNKHIQISMMDLIYSQACLTIVAAKGDAYDGLPGVNELPRSMQKYLKVGQLRMIEWLVPLNRILISNWITRAWTYQEGAVSKRRLFFTDDGVAFWCRQMYCQESVKERRLPRYPAKDVSNAGEQLASIIPRVADEFRRPRFAQVMNQYSRKTMSSDSDALNACLGVLRALDTTHCWGVAVDSYARPTLADNLDMSNDGCPSPYDSTLQTLSQLDRDPASINYTWKPAYLERSVMYLAWINMGPVKECKERKEFPTWSWTRWGGEKYHQDRRHYIVRRSCLRIHTLIDDMHDMYGIPRFEILVDDMQWLNVFDQFHRLRTLDGSKLGKILRVTGHIVTPRYDEIPEGLEMILTTKSGFDLHLETFIDSLEWTWEDLADTVALEIFEFFKEYHDSDVYGTVLILKPVEGRYRRIGVAGYVRNGHESLRSSKSAQIRLGTLAIAGAITRTVHIV
jgi:hypothetical protein